MMASRTALLLATMVAQASCTRPIPIEGRPCPCDEVAYTCCPATGTCMPLDPGQRGFGVDGRGQACETASALDGGGSGNGDSGGPARPAELIFEPPMIESIPGFDVCVSMSLRFADDGSVVPLAYDALLSFSSIGADTYRPGNISCPDGQGPLVFEPFADSAGELDVRVSYQGAEYHGLIDTTILPYRFEITTAPVTAPIGQVTPVPMEFTFYGHNETVDWENPYAHLFGPYTVEVADPEIAQVVPGGIQGLRSGGTTFVVHYMRYAEYGYGPGEITTDPVAVTVP
jgi:hypothetical protein